MNELKNIYVDHNGYNNWCSTERGHKSDMEYISVEWLKRTIAENTLINYREINVVSVDELLKLIEE